MSDGGSYDVAWMSEEEFPVRCADCDYLLTGLGESGRCPECAHLFDRYSRLLDTYRHDVEMHDLGLDETFDLSLIPESTWPVHCEDCRYCLTGLGASGRCPECGTSFDRRRRLWEIHGPEAFAGIVTRREKFQIPWGNLAIGGGVLLGFYAAFRTGIFTALTDESPYFEAFIRCYILAMLAVLILQRYRK